MGSPVAGPEAVPLTAEALAAESERYAGTRGVSALARGAGLRPAFRDRATGEIFLARFRDGRPAPLHILDGLPDRYVVARDAAGHVRAVGATIEAGFVDELGVFLTREEAARR